MIQIASPSGSTINNAAGLKQGAKDTSGFGALFSGILSGTNADSVRINDASAGSFPLSNIPVKGQALVEWLKKYAYSRFGKTDSVTVDSDALSWFRNLLIHAGFDKNEVDGIINQLKENDKGGNISLSDLFAKVASLEEEHNDNGDVLPASIIPYLQSLLTSVGLDDATLESILAGATEADGGISLSRLTAALKGLDSTADNGKSASVSDLIDRIKSAVLDAGDNQTAPADSSAEMTLDDVIAELEEMMAGKSGANFRGYLVSEDIRGFLSGLREGETLNTDTVLAKNTAILSALGRMESNGRGFDNDASGTGRNGIFNHQENSASTKELLFERYFGSPDKETSVPLKESFPHSRPGSLSAGIAASFSQESASSAARTSGVKSEQNLHIGYQVIRETGLTYTESSSQLKGGPPRNLPFYMMQQVGRQVFRSIQNGEKEVLLQLKPPHLGRLKLSLETVKDVVRVSIVTDNRSTRELLKSHADELKATLLEQGIRLEKLDVRIDFNFGQSMAQARQESNNSRERNQQEFRIDEEDTGRRLVENAGLPGVAVRNAGILDLVV